MSADMLEAPATEPPMQDGPKDPIMALLEKLKLLIAERGSAAPVDPTRNQEIAQLTGEDDVAPPAGNPVATPPAGPMDKLQGFMGKLRGK